MKINNIKVNSFGNIENKEIELSDGINIIYGKNESGKSTLLKFIINMFYGTSKNKKGREFSDYERYKPWEKEEFSGKIKYTLDNGKQFEIFRDFNKKNPQIYNENVEEISKEFNIDKTNGNEFFIEQTKLDETTFLSSLVSMQQEVKLGKNEQNNLIQKLANYVGTGDDNISYKKAIEKINKKQIEEIGTTRTQGRPINIIKEEKYKLQDEIGELEEYKNRKYEIDDIKQKIEEQNIKNEEKLKYIKEIKQLEENKNIEKQKIIINETIIQNNNKTIEELKMQQKQIKEKLENYKQINKTTNKTNNKKYNIIYLAILIILIPIILIYNKNMLVSAIGTIIGIIDIILLIKYNMKNRNKIKNKEKQENNKKIELEKQKEKLETEINILEKNNENQKIEIKGLKENLDKKYIELIKNVDIKYQNIDNKEELKSNILNKKEELENLINKGKIEIHKIEIDKKNVMEKLEKLSQMEEKIEELNQKEININKLNESIELVKEILEKSYNKMKENVSPKFTQNLSENINKISSGKYKNIKINDEQGIIIEKENGEYIPAEKLSIGTIDQLYMSLRFASIKEISQEKMPIILDESFAYYDEERLKNILKYLNEEFNNQIIIFTCTNREKEILEKENIKYNCNVM